MSDTHSTAAAQPREIITRKQAKELSLTHYFTGKPCSRGHVSTRFLSSGGCIDCVNENNKSWVKNNPDKVKETQSRYYKKNSETAQSRSARWRMQNKERVALKSLEWRKNNPEKHKKQRAEMYARNRERIRAAQAAYHLTEGFSAINRAASSKRRALRRSAVPIWFGEIDQFLIVEASHLAALRSASTGFAWHVDHMIPLAARKASGLHCADNLQVIPASLNCRKRNSMIFTEPGEWLQHL